MTTARYLVRTVVEGFCLSLFLVGLGLFLLGLGAV